jgi:23S rRNA (pseudouridine1915-N3)-methyltransferase
MQCKLIAAGTKLPAWVNAGFAEYQKRIQSPVRLQLIEIEVGTRREAATMLARLDAKDYVAALDVRGKTLGTEDFAKWLAARMQAGKDLAFLIGGPDGLDPAVLARANCRLSLSAMTFPHALVRLVFAEQLYRALSVLAGHPYHRA